jgi:ribulose-5-phosphate 4-epimerase/fuculose-1-phosphate aldolase
MRNHGLIALGETAQEVLDITLMADKWAKVLNGLYSLGEPEFLSDEHAWRMVTRPDEAIRKKAANK